MMAQLGAWWRARTRRERLFLQIAAAFVCVFILPGWIYLSASAYRAGAAHELAAAREISAEVARIGEQARLQRASFAGVDGAVRDRALAAAQESALSIARFEEAGADRVRVVFEGVSSVALYRWVEAAGQKRIAVTRSAITRIGESDQVNAEFEIAEAQ